SSTFRTSSLLAHRLPFARLRPPAVGSLARQTRTSFRSSTVTRLQRGSARSCLTTTRDRRSRCNSEQGSSSKLDQTESTNGGGESRLSTAFFVLLSNGARLLRQHSCL